MPRAKTGCTYVLYTLVTKKGMDSLAELVKKAPPGVGRPLVVDAILRRAARQKLPRIIPPTYKPHAKVKRQSLNK